jgi:hypothetical protein
MKSTLVVKVVETSLRKSVVMIKVRKSKFTHFHLLPFSSLNILSVMAKLNVLLPKLRRDFFALKANWVWNVPSTKRCFIMGKKYRYMSLSTTTPINPLKQYELPLCNIAN